MILRFSKVEIVVIDSKSGINILTKLSFSFFDFSFSSLTTANLILGIFDLENFGTGGFLPLDSDFEGMLDPMEHFSSCSLKLSFLEESLFVS